MDVAAALQLPLARISAAATKEGLNLLGLSGSQRRDISIENQHQRQNWDYPGEDECGWRSPLDGVEWAREHHSNREQRVRNEADKAAVLKLKDGESLASLDGVSQNLGSQWVVKVVEGEVEEAHKLLSVATLDKLGRCLAGIDRLGFVRDARILHCQRLPGGDVGVDIGEDEVDQRLIFAAQVTVDFALNGWGRTSSSGAKVDKGVLRQSRAKLPNEKLSDHSSRR